MDDGDGPGCAAWGRERLCWRPRAAASTSPIRYQSMTSSFAKNINNGWEEFVGEVRNFRGRYPLASLGVLYLADAKVVDDPAHARLLDMLRKLRGRDDDRSRFDATGLLIVRREGGRVLIQRDPVPPDLRADCFFQHLLVSVFASVRVQDRHRARSLCDASIPTKEPALGSTTAQTRLGGCGLHISRG
jgi:hypothetical protein